MTIAQSCWLHGLGLPDASWILQRLVNYFVEEAANV